MKSLKKNRNAGLDIFRAAAVTLVLFCHTCQYVLIKSLIDPVTEVLGFTGVELFFVLSGFLIGTILIVSYEKSGSPDFTLVREFWIRRWFRTLPNYYLVLVFYIITYYILFGEAVLAQPKFYLNLVFLSNTFYSQPRFYNHAWSLAIEEWFYLTFPILLGVIHITFSMFNKQRRILMATSIFLISILCFRAFAAIKWHLYWSGGIRKMMEFRLDSIAIGVVFAYLKFYYPAFWKTRKIIMLLFGACGLILLEWMVTALVIQRITENFFMKTIFFSLFSLSAGLIIPFIEQLELRRFPKIVSVITYLSLISYSVYLIHPLLVLLFDSVRQWQDKPVLKFIGVWVLTLGIGSAQYFFFELPVTNLRQRYASRTPGPVLEKRSYVPL